MKTHMAEIEITQRCMAEVTEKGSLVQILTIIDNKNIKIIKKLGVIDYDKG